MRKDNFDELITMAKKDKDFFHALVFDADTALKQISFLSEKTKEMIRRLNSKKLFAVIVGELQPRRDDNCPGTCGHDTCPATCEESCGYTCNDSCGWTHGWD